MDGKWQFKTVKVVNGKPEFVSLSEEQLTRAESYREALERASLSQVSNPPFSNYFVKESIGVPGAPVPFMGAGNIEYGWCQALHGEESAVAAFRTIFGRRDKTRPQPVLGIIAGNPEYIANPCGNCRDIMLEDLGKDFEIVSGAPEGGMAVVVKMSDYLKCAFTERDLDHGDLRAKFTAAAILMLNSCPRLNNDAYSPKNIHPERQYYAMILGESEDPKKRPAFYGAHDVMCEYHPIYALRDAVRQARRARYPFFDQVFILGANDTKQMPHVMYKDRQHLLELNLQCELLRSGEVDPNVHLMLYDRAEYEKNGAVYLEKVWTTNVKEWLPFPFSPANFGPEFLKHLTDYYKKKDRE